MYLAFEVSLIILLSDFLTCRKILRHGANGFTSPKDGVLRTLTALIALKNPSSRPDLNPGTVGPMARMLIYTTEATNEVIL
jgi:hypothetical protein